MVLKMTDKKTSDALYVIKSFAILSVIAAHMGFVPPENVGNNQMFETSAKIEDGRWHHVALSYDSATRKVLIYKDYEQVHEGTTINPLWLDSGSIQIGAGDMAFDGWIDEVRLTDRVLTPSQFLHVVKKSGSLISLY